MERNLPENVPYIAHEGEVTRLCGIIKRLCAIIVLLVILLVASNGAWMIYESQFEEVVQTVEQEADNGTNNFVGGDYNGETEDHD